MADIRIDQLNGTVLPSVDHVFPAMKDGVTVKLTVQQVSDLVRAVILNGAPEALDTLNELAAALGDDANYAATVTTALAGKLAKDQHLDDLPDKPLARSNLGAQANLGRYYLPPVDLTEAVSAIDLAFPAGTKRLELSGDFLCSDLSATVRLHMSTDSGASFSGGPSDYITAQFLQAGASALANNGGADSAITVGGQRGDATLDSMFQTFVFRGSAAQSARVISQSPAFSSPDRFFNIFQGYKSVVGEITHVRLFPSSGNLGVGSWLHVEAF